MADTILAEMHGIVRRAAEPRLAADTAKAAISRAAERLGIPFRRARSFWYSESTAAVGAAEAEKLRAAELRLLQERRRRLEEELEVLRWHLREMDLPATSLSGREPSRTMVEHSGLVRKARLNRERHLAALKEQDYWLPSGETGI